MIPQNKRLRIMLNNRRYQLSNSLTSFKPNLWDVIIFTLIIGLLAAVVWGVAQMTSPYQIGEPIYISLEPEALPRYALSTVLRMFIALIFSLGFTFIVAPLAAKNKHAENFIIPAIDILQSIPILGMLSLTVVAFIHFFPNSLLGPECAAIFAIFTSQVWNMTLSLYQSLKTVPDDLKEAAKMYRLSAWQRYWKIEVPHGAPGLLWNTMVSMSAGWFFVVVSEAITVSNQNITLPGVGSYISKAILEKNLPAIGYAILAMFIVILIYDQLLFRPLLCWAEKFKAEIDEEDTIYESWFFDLLAKTKVLKLFEAISAFVYDIFVNGPRFIPTPKLIIKTKYDKYILENISTVWNIALALALLFSCYIIGKNILSAIELSEIGYVFYLGIITSIKVFVLIIIASLIWIPIGVWIGLNAKVASLIQPLIQFLAAFPANLLYPVVAYLILQYGLNKHIWTTPLMILGTQWYILFNVIAGTTNIPKEIKLAAKNFQLKGWLWWKKLILPAIFPFYATGAMTAAGGCWNASIVAEFVQWGDTTITSPGIGFYIEEYTKTGDFPRILLGISVMCIYVILFNKILWQKLYNLAESRYSI